MLAVLEAAYTNNLEITVPHKWQLIGVPLWMGSLIVVELGRSLEKIYDGEQQFLNDDLRQ